MSDFIQLHFLTAYPPANLNRDDLGRPKTAMFGGTQRLRVSSQSLKRAWRTSDVFKAALEGHTGQRTKDLGNEIYKKLQEALGEKDADKAAKAIAGQYGALKSAKKGAEDAAVIERQHETLVFYSPAELQAIDGLAQKLVKEKRPPKKEELEQFPLQGLGAADISLFGRMLADNPGKNVEAAAQVAHALSVHKVTVEDDFFTAVDDLNKGDEDRGAGHMGTTEFAAGLFYEYVCIDRGLLVKNLGGNTKLAEETLAALAEACLTVSPTGKRTTFASNARASFALVEKGAQAPRSLAVAFLKSVEGADPLQVATAALKDTVARMDKVYGKCADHRYILDVNAGEGSLKDLVAFMAKA